MKHKNIFTVFTKHILNPYLYVSDVTDILDIPKVFSNRINKNKALKTDSIWISGVEHDYTIDEIIYIYQIYFEERLILRIKQAATTNNHI